MPGSRCSSTSTDKIVFMGFNWEEILDAEGNEIADAYDDSASDALYQDDPGAAPAALA